MIRHYFLIFMLLILGGCAGVEKNIQESLQQSRQKDTDIHEGYLKKLYSEYVKQFLNQEAPHATLIGYPYEGYDNLKTGAYVPSKIDNVGVKSLLALRKEFEHPASWYNQPSYGWYTPDQTLLPLRIKPGTYDIEIWGGAYTPKITKLKNVKISPNKQYIIFPKNGMVSINEFTIDEKFGAREKERYIIGQAVSAEVKYGEGSK